MNCSRHEEREAVGMCVRCHNLICEECKVEINNKYYCKNCVSEMYSDNIIIIIERTIIVIKLL